MGQEVPLPTGTDERHRLDEPVGAVAVAVLVVDLDDPRRHHGLFDHPARRQRGVIGIGQEVHAVGQLAGGFCFGRGHGGDDLAQCGAKCLGER
jgi:hypothetical protein